MSERLRVLIAGSGTGGHVYPALAVGRALAGEGHTVTFVGCASGLERQIVRDFPLVLLPSAPVRGRAVPGALLGSASVPRAVAAAVRAVRNAGADAVFGTGGHVSAALLAAARLCGVPSVAFECNLVPGLASRVVWPFATKTATGWAGTGRPFNRSSVTTGVPVRAELFNVTEPRFDDRTRILVFGGSLGSRWFNEVVTAAFRRLPGCRDAVTVTHLCAGEDQAATAAAYREAGWSARVGGYTDDMAEAYAGCDLVIGNAGASTCAELAATRRPSILLPLAAAGGHQHHNAHWLADAGACTVVHDAAALATALGTLAASSEARRAMSAAVATLSRPRAASRVAALLQAAALRARATSRVPVAAP